VDAAVELIGAQYGALGVIAPHGGLEQFIYVGMTASEAETIGHLPEGHGLLGALIEDPRPIRLEHLGEDPRSAGFPPGHPPMDAFLGVPVRVGAEVFGNLYLTNTGSTVFSADDEELASSLAATAGLAINNARLYYHARRRQEWIAATGDLVASVLSTDSGDPLRLVATRLTILANAPRADVFRHSSASVHSGTNEHSGANDWSTTEPVIDDSRPNPRPTVPLALEGTALEAAASSREPILLDVDSDGERNAYATAASSGRVVAVPILGPSGVDAFIVVSRPEQDPAFSSFDIDLFGIVSRQLSLALQLAEARAGRQRERLSDERARIARDLHDLVIQQIYAAGLELQTITGLITDPTVLHRISGAIDSLDASISQIRNVVFALSAPSPEDEMPLRYKLIDLASEYGSALRHTPSVSFAGAVDIMVNGDLADDIVAVARESLTNVAKHSRAQTATMAVSIVEDEVVVEVTDDGDGMKESTRRSGLANLEQRAVRRGGRFSLDSGRHGTRLYWAVPLGSSSGGR
jgi:signal transduction histidine kinase